MRGASHGRKNLLGSFFQVCGEHGVDMPIPLHFNESRVFRMGFADNLKCFVFWDVLEILSLTHGANNR